MKKALEFFGNIVKGEKKESEEIIDLVELIEEPVKKKLGDREVVGIVNNCLLSKGGRQFPEYIAEKQELSRPFIDNEDREHLTMGKIKFNEKVKEMIASIVTDVRKLENSAVADKYAGRKMEMIELGQKFSSMLYADDELVNGINNKNSASEVAIEKPGKPGAVVKFAPETSYEMLVMMKEYEASIKSLEFEISVLKDLIYNMEEDSDSLQVSIYYATLENINEQIVNLNKTYGGNGFVDLDKELENIKIRFDQLKKTDVENLKAQVG